ncbi:MAG: hypothetical protein CL908_00200 [Deltaproteobacteria bacterium]|nr:hypothetical protein [Deltaproteobacteria bacterium]
MGLNETVVCVFDPLDPSKNEMDSNAPESAHISSDPGVTGDLLLRLSWNDVLGEMTPSYSVDGGTSFQTPFAARSASFTNASFQLLGGAQEGTLLTFPIHEMTWGGTYDDPDVVGSPYPLSSQPSTLPVVADLTGDGIPEIVFTTYCQDPSVNGVLRAIHGGGPDRGLDYFARCGPNHWSEGDALPATCACATGNLNPSAALAVGDIDGDDIPEIAAFTETDRIRIYDNTGATLLTPAAGQALVAPAMTIANLDQEGFAEVIVGNEVYVFEHDIGGDLALRDRFIGNLTQGSVTTGAPLGPVVCVADLSGDSALEIAAGPTVYALPAPPPACFGNRSAAARRPTPRRSHSAMASCSSYGTASRSIPCPMRMASAQSLISWASMRPRHPAPRIRWMGSPN